MQPCQWVWFLSVECKGCAPLSLKYQSVFWELDSPSAPKEAGHKEQYSSSDSHSCISPPLGAAAARADLVQLQLCEYRAEPQSTAVTHRQTARPVNQPGSTDREEWTEVEEGEKKRRLSLVLHDDWQKQRERQSGEGRHWLMWRLCGPKNIFPLPSILANVTCHVGHSLLCVCLCVWISSVAFLSLWVLTLSHLLLISFSFFFFYRHTMYPSVCVAFCASIYTLFSVWFGWSPIINNMVSWFFRFCGL